MPWGDSRLHVHERRGHGKRDTITCNPTEHQANQMQLSAPLSQVLERRASPQVQDKQLPGSTASLTGMSLGLNGNVQD